MLVLLFIVFFGLPGIGIDVPPLLAMMLSLGLISGAYLSEVFRGALAAVNPNEVLAAQSMGFTRFETLRLIKLPQMMRFSVPGMVNELTHGAQIFALRLHGGHSRRSPSRRWRSSPRPCAESKSMPRSA